MQILYSICRFIAKRAVSVRQKLCIHHWTYHHSTVLVGRRWAQFQCTNCGKIGHRRYDHDFECSH
jgi:hypothetical protein